MAKKNKCGNYAHKSKIVDDIKFISTLEADFYEKELKPLKEQGIITQIDRQVTYILEDKYIIVDGKIIEGSDPDFNKIKRKTKAKTFSAIKYTPDFNVTYADGSYKIFECKGKSTTDFEIRKRLFLKKYPQYLDSFFVIGQDKKEDKFMDYYELVKLEKERKAEKAKLKNEKGNKKNNKTNTKRRKKNN